MSHTDMFNREKDLISEYLAEYPVLRYIMPSFMNNGVNVSHKLHILRQAYWVLVQILNAENSVIAPIATNTATIYNLTERTDTHDTNDVTKLVPSEKIATNYKAIPALNLTADDIQLLALFLKIAREDFAVNTTQKIATIVNTLAISKDIIYQLPITGVAGVANFKELLTIFVDSSNGITADKVTLLDHLTTGVVVPALEVSNNATPIAAAELREIANYSELSTFITKESFNGPLFHTVPLNKLFFSDETTVVKSIIDATTPESKGKTTSTPTKRIYPAFLTLRSIFSLSNSVYLMCSAAQNSFTGAMGPVKSSTAEFTFAFDQTANGLFVLKKFDKSGKIVSQDFSDDFSKLVEGNEFCRAFGAGNASKSTDPAEIAKAKFACASLVADCLGETTHNTEACRANFAKVAVPTKKFRGWNKLSKDQRRYASYRILLGLGIAGRWNSDGNLTFANNDVPIYDEATIKTLIPGANAEHVEYVQTLMKTLGTIETTAKKVDGVARPSMSAMSVPKFITINPRLAGTAGLSGLSGFSGLRNIIGNMNGGAIQEEQQISSIQYGGGIDDANRIILSITGKMNALKTINPKALPPSKEQYIRNKMSSFESLAREIDDLERIVITYITLASQHPAKDIVFTELEVNNFKAEAEKRQQLLASKINKFESLGNLMVNKMAISFGK